MSYLEKNTHPWEDEFDAEWNKPDAWLVVRHSNGNSFPQSSQVKEFIRRLLTEQREQILKELRETPDKEIGGTSANAMEKEEAKQQSLYEAGVQPGIAQDRGLVLALRGEIEKILWKHYDPDASPNMEKVAGEIIGVLTRYNED